MIIQGTVISSMDPNMHIHPSMMPQLGQLASQMTQLQISPNHTVPVSVKPLEPFLLFPSPEKQQNSSEQNTTFDPLSLSTPIPTPKVSYLPPSLPNNNLTYQHQMQRHSCCMSSQSTVNQILITTPLTFETPQPLPNFVFKSNPMYPTLPPPVVVGSVSGGLMHKASKSQSQFEAVNRHYM